MGSYLLTSRGFPRGFCQLDLPGAPADVQIQAAGFNDRGWSPESACIHLAVDMFEIDFFIG